MSGMWFREGRWREFPGQQRSCAYWYVRGETRLLTIPFELGTLRLGDKVLLRYAKVYSLLSTARGLYLHLCRGKYEYVWFLPQNEGELQLVLQTEARILSFAPNGWHTREVVTYDPALRVGLYVVGRRGPNGGHQGLSRNLG